MKNGNNRKHLKKDSKDNTKKNKKEKILKMMKRVTIKMDLNSKVNHFKNQSINIKNRLMLAHF